MAKRIRLIYLSLIIPLLFVLRLYQIYMNLGINPVIVDFLREKNFLWIVLALTIYPVASLCIRTIRELKKHRYITWDKCFILVAAVIADIQLLVLLKKGLINQTNAQYFLAYQLIGLCAYYIGRYQKDVLRAFIYVMVGIITATAVYGLVEWGVFAATKRRILLNVFPDGRLISFYGNSILAGSSFIVGFWLASIIGSIFVKTIVKGIIVTATFATMSRSCWLGLVLSMILLWGSGKTIAKNKRYILIMVGLGFTVITGVIAFVPYIRNLSFGRFMNITESYSYQLRMEYWEFGIKHFFGDTSLLSKLIGTGYTSSERLITSSEVYAKWKDIYSYDIHFDNVYISILTEFGLIGLGAVIITTLRAFRGIFKGKKENMFCAFGIAALIPAALFWDPIYCPINMIMFIAVAGMIMSGDEEQPVSVRKLREKIMNDKSKKPIPAPKFDESEEWVQECIAQFGAEPSFF